MRPPPPFKLFPQGAKGVLVKPRTPRVNPANVKSVPHEFVLPPTVRKEWTLDTEKDAGFAAAPGKVWVDGTPGDFAQVAWAFAKAAVLHRGVLTRVAAAAWGVGRGRDVDAGALDSSHMAVRGGGGNLHPIPTRDAATFAWALALAASGAAGGVSRQRLAKQAKRTGAVDAGTSTDSSKPRTAAEEWALRYARVVAAAAHPTPQDLAQAATAAAQLGAKDLFKALVERAVALGDDPSAHDLQAQCLHFMSTHPAVRQFALEQRVLAVCAERMAKGAKWLTTASGGQALDRLMSVPEGRHPPQDNAEVDPVAPALLALFKHTASAICHTCAVHHAQSQPLTEHAARMVFAYAHGLTGVHRAGCRGPGGLEGNAAVQPFAAGALRVLRALTTVLPRGGGRGRGSSSGSSKGVKAQAARSDLGPAAQSIAALVIPAHLHVHECVALCADVGKQPELVAAGGALPPDLLTKILTRVATDTAASEQHCALCAWGAAKAAVVDSTLWARLAQHLDRASTRRGDGSVMLTRRGGGGVDGAKLPQVLWAAAKTHQKSPKLWTGCMMQITAPHGRVLKTARGPEVAMMMWAFGHVRVVQGGMHRGLPQAVSDAVCQHITRSALLPKLEPHQLGIVLWAAGQMSATLSDEMKRAVPRRVAAFMEDAKTPARGLFRVVCGMEQHGLMPAVDRSALAGLRARIRGYPSYVREFRSARDCEALVGMLNAVLGAEEDPNGDSKDEEVSSG